MTRIFRRVVVAALLLSAGTAGAVAIQEGQRYHGPVTLESPDTGVSLVLPKGWVGMLPSGSDSMVVSNGSNNGNIRVMVRALGRQEAAATMAQTMTLDDGMTLQPKGRVTASGNILTGDYNAMQYFRSYEAFMAAHVGNNGQTVAVVAVFQPSGRKAFSGTALQLARSARFAKPMLANAGNDSGAAGDFFANLQDRKITRYYRGSGYSETTELVLCRNGLFQRNFAGGQRESAASYSYTMSANNRYGGSWRVNGSQLVLQYNDGDRAVYNLSMKNGNELYMDGKRWFRERITCQ